MCKCLILTQTLRFLSSHSAICYAAYRAKNENGRASSAVHLIVVAGHSVTISGHLEDAGEDESDWFLLDYQKNQGYVVREKTAFRGLSVIGKLRSSRSDSS